MKYWKSELSDRALLAVAVDVAKSFTIPKYEQFLTKHELLSYNPDDYSRFNKIDYIYDTLDEIDVRFLIELLDEKHVLSKKTKTILIQEGMVFENSINTEKDTTAPKDISKQLPRQNSQNNSLPHRIQVTRKITWKSFALFPALIGYFFLDIFNRHDYKDTSAVILGWALLIILIIILILVLTGVISVNTLKSIWRFFIPAG